MKRTNLQLLVITFLFIGTQQVLAQCDGLLKPVSNSKLGYKTRKDRCEGFFASDVASNLLRIVSFTSGDFRFSPSKDEIIEITSLVPKLVLRAEAIPNDLFYRMDAELENGKFNWPVEEVLLQNERTSLARNIGILAFQRDSLNHKIYYPVKAKGRIAQTDVNETPLLKLVCTTSLEVVEWRVKGEQAYRKLNRSSFIAFSPILIRIPVEIKGQKQLQIRAKERNSTRWITLNFDANL